MSSFIRDIFDLFLKGTKVMTQIEDITASVDSLTTELQTVNLKLDDIAALIASLKAGQVTQAQLDELASKVAAAKTAADALVTEADAIG